jgi:cbb3-type cytochrome oxidase maturation protein
MIIAGTLVIVLLLGLTTSAVLAFWWAADSGQFKDPKEGARSIFDADEPVGVPTDHFPQDSDHAG